MKPTQSRLAGLVNISEERNLWLRGTLVAYPDIVVEISFEREGVPLPGTLISYFGMWNRGPRGTIFEFQLGKIAKVPSPDAYERHVLPIIERLQDYAPPRIMF